MSMKIWLKINSEESEPVEVSIREVSDQGRYVWNLAVGGEATTHASAEDAFDALVKWVNISNRKSLAVCWTVETQDGELAVKAIHVMLGIIAAHAQHDTHPHAVPPGSFGQPGPIRGSKAPPASIHETRPGGHSLWVLTVNGGTSTHKSVERAFHALVGPLPCGQEIEIEWGFVTPSGRAEIDAFFAKLASASGEQGKQPKEWKS